MRHFKDQRIGLERWLMSGRVIFLTLGLVSLTILQHKSFFPDEIKRRSFRTNKLDLDTEKKCRALSQKEARGFDLNNLEVVVGDSQSARTWAVKAGIFSNESDTEIELDCRLYEPDDSRIIYFLHIHKAGGSTMCSAARANNVYSHYAHNCNMGTSRNPQRCCGGKTLREHEHFAATTKYRFVANEWPMYEAMDTDHFRYIVTLRDSRERYFSHACHDRVPINDFESWLDREPDNFNMRMICGTRCLLRPKYQLTWQDFEYTVERLRRFDSIILMDSFNRTYHAFASKVGWKMWPGKKNTRSRIKPPAMDPIMHILDDALYKVAQSLSLGEKPDIQATAAVDLYFVDVANWNTTTPCGHGSCQYKHAWGNYLNSLLLKSG